LFIYESGGFSSNILAIKIFTFQGIPPSFQKFFSQCFDVSVRTDDLQSVRQKLSADMADHSGIIRDIAHAQNFSIFAVRMRAASLSYIGHKHIFSIPTVRMRTAFLFLHCACAELLYSCSVDGHNFSLPAMHIGTTSIILNCASAQLLYSCSHACAKLLNACNAHAHNFIFPQCACTQLLYSYSAHVHNFSFF
jgi:hypothetical protein